MKCPVCPNPAVDEAATRCQQCGTDVAPLRRLEQVRQLAATAQPKRGAWPLVATHAVVALLAGTAAIMWMGGAQSASPAAALTRTEANVLSTSTLPPATAAANTTALESVETKLRGVAGVSTSSAKHEVVVRFEEGLFHIASDELEDGAAERLRGVADALAHCRCLVIVEGFTDAVAVSPSSRWKDNWMLAFHRSHAAVKALRDADPSIVWLSAAGSPDAAPFPNDDEAGRRRNRTVLLHVAEVREE